MKALILSFAIMLMAFGTTFAQGSQDSRKRDDNQKTVNRDNQRTSYKMHKKHHHYKHHSDMH
jgi:hypothetical protein